MARRCSSRKPASRADADLRNSCESQHRAIGRGLRHHAHRAGDGRRRCRESTRIPSPSMPYPPRVAARLSQGARRGRYQPRGAPSRRSGKLILPINWRLALKQRALGEQSRRLRRARLLTADRLSLCCGHVETSLLTDRDLMRMPATQIWVLVPEAAPRRPSAPMAGGASSVLASLGVGSGLSEGFGPMTFAGDIACRGLFGGIRIGLAVSPIRTLVAWVMSCLTERSPWTTRSGSPWPSLFSPPTSSARSTLQPCAATPETGCSPVRGISRAHGSRG